MMVFPLSYMGMMKSICFCKLERGWIPRVPTSYDTYEKKKNLPKCMIIFFFLFFFRPKSPQQGFIISSWKLGERLGLRFLYVI